MEKNQNRFFILNEKREKQTMKRLTIIITLFFIITAVIAINAFSGQSGTANSNLIIHIKGFENSDGVACVALVNSKENYEAKIPFKGFYLEITKNEVIKTISNLPFGEYAVKVYHDENANKELDTKMFGIPAERYGFSNDAKAVLGPPEYKNAAFTLDSPEKEITITIQ